MNDAFGRGKGGMEGENNWQLFPERLYDTLQCHQLNVDVIFLSSEHGNRLENVNLVFYSCWEWWKKSGMKDICEWKTFNELIDIFKVRCLLRCFLFTSSFCHFSHVKTWRPLHINWHTLEFTEHGHFYWRESVCIITHLLIVGDVY